MELSVVARLAQKTNVRQGEGETERERVWKRKRMNVMSVWKVSERERGAIGCRTSVDMCV